VEEIAHIDGKGCKSQSKHTKEAGHVNNCLPIFLFQHFHRVPLRRGSAFSLEISWNFSQSLIGIGTVKVYIAKKN
jgi:hypothetical protein